MIGGGYLAEGSLFAGRYRIARELGRGGVSVVYAARDTQVGQDIALKLLVPSPATANQTRERMRREVNAVRRLAHPNIVAVYDFAEDGPYGAVIMELVDGEDLDRRVRRSGPLPPDDVVRIGGEVAAALAAAHRHGVLHRDVKPKNILLDHDGRARLTDFGSARMEGDATITRTGAIVGTLAYMAPETAEGRRGDARSDVFALGMTLFHAVSGRLPDRPSPHLPLPPSSTGYSPIAVDAAVPLWIGHVIARATCADPTDRYPTPTALADALTSGDAGVGAGLVSLARDQCVICGAVDVLGTVVCPACSSAASPADALVFLTGPRSPLERDRMLDAAAELLGPEVQAETLAAVAKGDRPLMRVPAESERRVVEILGARRIGARVVRERELWRALPLGFLFLVGMVIIAGMVAGAVVDPLLAAAAVPFALLLLGGGVLGLRRPALSISRQDTALSEPTRSRIAETFAVLPVGPARSLLADVVRRGQSVRRALALRQDSSGIGVTVDDLLALACASARDLASLDDSLAQFDRERARGDGDAAWNESLAECERARDSAVQHLLDAVTVLGQLDTQSIRGFADVNARLSELVAEIAGEVKTRVATREEMESLLTR
ncbi:MAG TPA: serine/threonine-protein kinase [Gemmatimonadaceae bacterium]|nr:serine/threonine-protein kinase [Gemmatimonadaceae bacterium]